MFRDALIAVGLTIGFLVIGQSMSAQMSPDGAFDQCRSMRTYDNCAHLR